MEAQQWIDWSPGKEVFVILFVTQDIWTQQAIEQLQSFGAFERFEYRGPTEDIISYFTLMSSEIHYYDIIEKMGSWTLMSSEV